MQIKILEVTKEGQIVRKTLAESMSWLKNSLLECLYPGIEVARVEVPVEPLDTCQQAVLEQALGNLVLDGKKFCLVGASGSAQNGKFYAVDTDHAKQIGARFQYWPEAAISYFGILVSECRFGLISEPNASVLVVKDGHLGTNDCRGWISQRLFGSIKGADGRSLPLRRFYQFRMAFDTLNAKGSFKVMGDEVADVLKADVILPESSLKPALRERSLLEKWIAPEGRRFSGPVLLGIREISEKLEFKSSYTLTVHAPEDSLEMEILPAAVAEVARLTRAATEGDYSELLQLLGASETRQGEIEPDSDFTSVETHICSAVLKADASGVMIKHPYVNGKLQHLLARWTFKACTSGGFKLPGFALADDGFLFVRHGKVVWGSDWIPADAAISPLACRRGLVVGYPVRMKEDLLPVHCLSTSEIVPHLSQYLVGRGVCMEAADAKKVVDLVEQQLRLEGTLTLHSKTASKNGGDFDFDYVCVIEGNRFPRWVESRFADPGRPAQEKQKLAKRKSPWWNLPQAAMSARGNQIGSITDLITSCLAAGQPDLAYLLVEELQGALDGLKHGTEPDPKVIARIRSQVRRAPWLEFKKARKVSDLPLKLEVAKTDKVGRLYNRIRLEIEDLFGESAPLAHFKGLISGNTFSREMFEECQLVNRCWAAAVTAILEKQQRLNETANQAQAEYVAAQDKDSILKNQAFLRRNQAYRALREFEDKSIEEFRKLVLFAQKWAMAKTVNRSGWAEALLHIVSGGKGRGALLFQTFAQELVDSLVEKTGGRPVVIEIPELPDGEVLIEQGDDKASIFWSVGDHKTLLVELTSQGDVVMDGHRIMGVHPFPLRSGNGEVRDGKLLFTGIPQRPGVRVSRIV